MKLRERRFVENPRLMIIPMIDIIFFLLVFFMMNTLFMIEQKALPVALPEASTSQAGSQADVPVTVLADGTIRLGDQAMDAATLEKKIRGELAGNSEVRFVLQADKAVAYGRVVEVFDVLRRAGVKRLTVAVEPTP
jgi:biopolymer transport protein ExbD